MSAHPYPDPILFSRRARWPKRRLNTSEQCDAAIRHTWALCDHGLLSWGGAKRHDTRIRRKRSSLPKREARNDRP